MNDRGSVWHSGKVLRAARSALLIAGVFAAAAIATPVCIAGAEQAAATSRTEWGTLRGRFRFDGQPPEPPAISLNKDAEYCSKHKPVDETLLVDKATSGLANVVVRLETKSGTKLPTHESYRQAESSKILLDNTGCRFAPHICLLRTSQTLVIRNSDEVAHNTAAYLDRNDPFNEITPPAQTAEKRIERPERMPAKVNCSIHAWMGAWLVVSDHPYAAVTDAKGNFEIPNIPTGEYTFQIWHEKSGWIRKATRDGNPVEWSRGRVTLRIEPGANNLGEIRVNPEIFRGEE